MPSQLADARAEMTSHGIRNATRAQKTFVKRNGENVSYILWLFDNMPHFLNDEFRRVLQREDGQIDYDAFFRKKYRGKKTPEERKVDFRKQTLAKACKAILKDLSQVGGIDLCICSNVPRLLSLLLAWTHNSQTPTMETVDLEAVSNNVADSFFEYLCARKKKGGGLMMASCYSGYRSGLTFLFKRYGRTIPADLNDEISDLMKGVKRIANKARQAGEVCSMSRLIAVVATNLSV